MLTVYVTKKDGSSINNGFIGYFSNSVKLQVVPFSGNSCNIILPPDADPFFIYAIEPDNYEVLKTYFGATPLWCGFIDEVGTEIFSPALPVATTEKEITIELLTGIKDGNNPYNIEFSGKCGVTGNPIKDVDVTLKKIPPGANYSINNGTSGCDFSGEYLNVDQGTYYIVLDIPNYKLIYDPKIDVNQNVKIEFKIDDGNHTINI